MTLPTKGNLPIQQRAGYNQGPQGLSLSQAKFLGQPAVKCGTGDTVIFRNSPIVPGESNPRALGMLPEVFGKIFNGSGGSIQYQTILLDAQGNEFLVESSTLQDKEYQELAIGNLSELMPFCMPVDWTLVVRVVSGNPNSGRGLVAQPWAHDMGRNLVSIVQPITTAGLEIGPPKGRAWQLAGNIVNALGEVLAIYMNFDSVERHVDEESLILAGEEFLTNIFAGTPQPVTVAAGGIDTALFDLLINKSKGLILAYPDKLKLVARENQTSAPLYVNINFAEFDLPRDMG